MEMIKEHRNIAKIIENIDKKKFSVPEDWNYEKAKQLFVSPDVKDPKTIEVGSVLGNLRPMQLFINLIISFF